MAKASKALMIPDELVMNKIYFIRGQKVMLDRDGIAKCDTIPEAFGRLSSNNWKSQFVVSNY